MAALQQQSQSQRQQQKRPFITNWFSSLRRQPKSGAANKKSTLAQSVGLFGSNDKRYQRSCIDLRSSTFYIPQSSYFIDQGNNCNNSIDNLLHNNQNHQNRQQEITKKLCIRCCCTITNQFETSPSNETAAAFEIEANAAAETITTQTQIPCENIDQNDQTVVQQTQNGSLTDDDTTNLSDNNVAGPSPTFSISTITSNMLYETEVCRKAHEISSGSETESTMSCSAPSTPTTPTTPTPNTTTMSSMNTSTKTANANVSSSLSSSSSPSPLHATTATAATTSTTTATTTTHIIQKTTEFRRVSTTKTIQTVIVTRPVEVLLNEKGEIIAKRRPPLPTTTTTTTISPTAMDATTLGTTTMAKKNFLKTGRSNSLDCVLDDTANGEPRSMIASFDILSNDLQFIDDIATNHANSLKATTTTTTPVAITPSTITTTTTTIITNGHNNSLENDENSFVTATTPRSMSISTPYASTNSFKQQQQQSLNKINRNNNNNINTINNNNNNNNNTYSHHNHNYNESNNLTENLCDNCRHVIERNLNNRTKQRQLKKKQQSKYNAVIYPGNKQIKDELCEVVSEMEALDVPEDCKHSNKDKQMSIGRKKFNMDPKKGIEYLVENRLLRHDPQDVAHFLYKGEGLNKTAIGDYLGENNDFNKDVLKAFVALHDFTNLILVQALRQFLWSFRLPGEAQKIDRMMECFAQRYCQLNPDIFTNTDTCYVLSFAIIMLNTSLHNPSVKDKPTVEQFISMNRGINNGGDLPRTLLESLYESIRTEPFKIPQDDGNDLMHTFFNPDKEGWLWKQGGRYKSWKRRWFILNDNCLYYFEYTTDKEPRGIIPLENISVREIHDRSKPNCFELFATGGADIIKACKTDSEGKVVEGKHTVYRMSAATEEEQQDWIKRLTQSISHNPFYDILVQRKKKALSKS